MSRTIPDRHPDLIVRQAPTWRQRLACLFGFHDWVARTDLGGDAADFIEEGSDLVTCFFEFAAPVCRHCQTQLPPRRP